MAPEQVPASGLGPGRRLQSEIHSLLYPFYFEKAISKSSFFNKKCKRKQTEMHFGNRCHLLQITQNSIVRLGALFALNWSILGDSGVEKNLNPGKQTVAPPRMPDCIIFNMCKLKKRNLQTFRPVLPLADAEANG